MDHQLSSGTVRYLRLNYKDQRRSIAKRHHRPRAAQDDALAHGHREASPKQFRSFLAAIRVLEGDVDQRLVLGTALVCIKTTTEHWITDPGDRTLPESITEGFAVFERGLTQPPHLPGN